MWNPHAVLFFPQTLLQSWQQGWCDIHMPPPIASFLPPTTGGFSHKATMAGQCETYIALILFFLSPSFGGISSLLCWQTGQHETHMLLLFLSFTTPLITGGFFFCLYYSVLINVNIINTIKYIFYIKLHELSEFQTALESFKMVIPEELSHSGAIPLDSGYSCGFWTESVGHWKVQLLSHDKVVCIPHTASISLCLLPPSHSHLSK